MCSDNARVAERFDETFFAIGISLYAGCAIFDAWQAADPVACDYAPGVETSAARRTNTRVPLHRSVAYVFPLPLLFPFAFMTILLIS